MNFKDIISNKKYWIAAVVVVVLYMIIRSLWFGHYGAITMVSTNSGGVMRAPMMDMATVDYDYAEEAEMMMGADDGGYAMNSAAKIAPGYDEIQDLPDVNTDRQLIKNAWLGLEVSSIDDSMIRIGGIVDGLGGHVVDSNVYEQPVYEHYRGHHKKKRAYKSASATVRVPSASFDLALGQIKDLAINVQSENVSSNDVTEQFTDLQARLESKQAEVQQYQTILRRATKISDVLEVTRYLNQAQAQAESMQGRLNYLQDQVSMSTISINLSAEQELSWMGVSWSPRDEIVRAFQSLVSALVGIANLAIKLVVMLPVLAIYAGIIWVLYRVARKVYKVVKKLRG